MTLPVLDLETLDAGHGIPALDATCRGAGFFYLRGHGIDPALVAAAETQMRALFALPLPERMAIDLANSLYHHGYEPMASQTTEPGTAPDRKEGFYIGNELPPDHPHVQAGYFNMGPNQWPAGLPQFRPTMTAYFDALTGVAIRLMRAMAEALGLPPSWFDPFCADPMCVLRLLHYPPQPPNPAATEKGVGTHTDWGCLTLLWQDETGGLQVQSGGTWIEAPPLPGTFVVNIGDMFARWTNGQYRSTPHRVMNRSGRDRFSMPFFFEGSPGHAITALPGTLAPGERPLYPPTTVSEHLAEMYRRTYA